MSTAVAATTYVGRFAPSPTGPLHFGSAVAAVASFLQARSRSGRWLVRIEDIDPPRERAGATAAILEGLVSLGLEWDDNVTYQSHMSDHYDEALFKLQTAGYTFPCACTRKQLGGGAYPGTCRNGIAPGLRGRSIRVRVGHAEITFVDQLQGPYSQHLGIDIGDYILKRADGLYSYHLAVVVDDAAAGVTEIVRGVDLLDSTPRQIYLQRLLGLQAPNYVHIPVVLNRAGTKLSKQTFAAPIDLNNSRGVLIEALQFLQQRPPPELLDADRNEILHWAVANWDISAVGKVSRAHDPATVHSP